MKIHYLQHFPSENPGSILTWAKGRGHEMRGSLLYKGDALPGLGDFDWLVVMGGPMNVDEETTYPWLRGEKELIRQAAYAGKTVLGFCLGGQLIAEALGGAVSKNREPEIGWLPIVWNCQARIRSLFSFFPETTTVLQWHGDTFSDLPPGAVHLADSEGCARQAFCWGTRVFGFQFHLEVTETMLEEFVRDFAQDVGQGTYVQSAAEIVGHPEYVAAGHELLAKFLSALEARG
jgi:GMP synthase-like glutamine amidotransferase